MLRDVNRESFAFYMQHCVCKKYKIDIKRCQLEAPYFLYMTMHV
jgi:hypothetical protein